MRDPGAWVNPYQNKLSDLPAFHIPPLVTHFPLMFQQPGFQKTISLPSYCTYVLSRLSILSSSFSAFKAMPHSLPFPKVDCQCLVSCSVQFWGILSICVVSFIYSNVLTQMDPQLVFLNVQVTHLTTWVLLHSFRKPTLPILTTILLPSFRKPAFSKRILYSHCFPLWLLNSFPSDFTQHKAKSFPISQLLETHACRCPGT